MAEGQGLEVQASGDVDRGRESLSQFLARVLDQSSLSSWLPAGALVLLLAFVIQLGTALDLPATSNAPDPVVRALQSIAGISIGGALLLLAAVIVVTMVTQALSFELSPRPGHALSRAGH